MKVRFMICCETCVIDGRTNNVSMINIIEEISAPSFPVTVPRLSIVVMLSRTEDEPDTANTSIRFAIDATILLETAFNFKFQGKLNTRGVGEFQGLVIPAPGRLNVSLVSDDKVLDDWDIRVHQIGAPRVDLFGGAHSS